MENNSAPMTTKKALTVIGMLILLLVLSMLSPATWFGVQPKKEKPLVLLSANDLSSLDQDRNRNNIPDWKDLILETMPVSTTTGGISKKLTDAEKDILNDPNNLTSSFSKKIYVASAQILKTGEGTTQSVSLLSESLLQEEARKIVPKRYAETDLTVLNQDSQIIKKTYGNALGKIYKKALTEKIGVGDLVIYEAYIESKNASLLETFTKKKNITENIIQSLLVTPVPYSLVPQHLLVINSLSLYKTSMENIASSEKDPLRGVIALTDYPEILQKISSSVEGIQTYFIQNNIMFSSSEPGYYLTSGYTQ